jgi:hypothetical protein
MGNVLRLSLSVAALALAGTISIASCATGKVVVTTSGTGGTGGAGGAGGTGGTGGATAGTGGATGGTGGTGGADVPCTKKADCESFNDACNVGACINGKCGQLPSMDGAPCDDGKKCTQNDVCQAGKCVGGGLMACPTSNPCMVGTCDVVTDTCMEVPGNNGAPCSLGDPCVVSSTCLSGVCQPGQVVDCSFLDSDCGTGYCDPMGGCKSMPKNDGTPCNDFQFCTVQDQCVSGSCKGLPNMCGAPNDPCKIAVCNEAQQTCVAMPGNDGAKCDDGNFCTGGETCKSGTCVGGMPANDGMMCDDNNGCTGGTTCSSGVCTNAQSQIQMCMDGDKCCPAGCQGVDNDCLWWASGVQQNIPESQLVGWQKCFTDPYGNSGTPFTQILSQCSKGKLLMACRQIGQSTFHTLAMGPRADVLHDCGSDSGCTFVSNGVGWYYSDSYSWGFVPGGEGVQRNSCDIQNEGSEDRICWHSSFGQINGGFRCGANVFLNSDFTWERVVYQAD